MQKLTFSLPPIQKPSKEELRRWLIALGIAAILACCLWALWSLGAASASASDAPAFHPPAHGATDPVSDRHNPIGHGRPTHLAGNAGSHIHLPYLGEMHGSGSGDSGWFIPPSDIHPFYNFSAGDDGFSFPNGGNWHDFGNQSRGLGISGPGGGGGGGPSAKNPQDTIPETDGPSDPSDKDPGQSPDPTGTPGNPPGELTSAVPEPATWAMFLIGFGTIGWMLRSARRHGPAATF